MSQRRWLATAVIFRPSDMSLGFAETWTVIAPATAETLEGGSRALVRRWRKPVDQWLSETAAPIGHSMTTTHMHLVHTCYWSPLFSLNSPNSDWTQPSTHTTEKQRRFSRPNFYSLRLGLNIYGLGLEGHGQGFESCIDNLLNHRQTRGPTTTAIVKLKVCLGQSVAMTDWTVCIEMKLNDNSFLNPTNVTCFTYLP